MAKPVGSIFNSTLRQIMYAEGLRQISFEALAADNDWFLTATNPTGASGGETITVDTFTKAYCPGWPVCPVVVYTETSGTDVESYTCTFKGINQFGQYEVLTVDDSSLTATSTTAFEKLTEVTLVVTGTTDAADTVIIGFAKTYGLGCMIGATTDVICKLFDGSADDGTVSAVHHTYVVAGTPDAAKELVLLVRPSYYYSK